MTHKLFGFEGRLRRRDWSLYSLGLFAVETAIIKGVELTIEGPSRDLVQGNIFTWVFADPSGPRMFLVHAAIMIALIWPNLAITIKRAHDRDTPGYWLTGALLVAYASFFLPDDLMERSGAALDRGDWLGALPLVAEVMFGLVMLGTVVVLGFLDGTSAPNRYGPSPKGDSERDLARVFD